MNILFLCAVVLFASRSEQMDQTMIERASGFHVVEAVVNRIQEKCVFEDDRLFLRRLAFVESQDGTDIDTYTASYFGGIWKVDENKFTLTKSVNSALLNAVKTEYGIDWTAVTWNDLLKPFYSGLAARIYLQKNFQIPFSLADQANLWVTHYRPSASSPKFISLSKQIKKVCTPVADLAFMLDDSGSVGLDNFQKVKEFVKAVTSNLNVGPDFVLNSRISVTVFSKYLNTIFDFGQHTTVSTYQNHIDSIPYRRGTTNTQLGLNYLTSYTFLLSKGARSSSVPKIAVVVTDGISDNKFLTLTKAADLLATDVKVLSIGVGKDLDISELKAIASDPDCNHLTVLKDFHEFDAFVNQFKKKVCDVETKISLNGIVSEMVKNEIKLYTYTIVEGCKVLAIETKVGEANVYYSFSYQPNPARYEGVVTVSPGTPRFLFSQLTTGILYIIVEALSDLTLTIKFPELSCSCPAGLVSVSFDVNLQQCTEGYNCTSNNPCSPSLIFPNKFYYPYTNAKKFVQCSKWGQCYEMPCPLGLVWNDVLQTCN